MKTVIMAGGAGTRISSIAQYIPKPMIKIAGKPVLEHAIECLRSQGFTDLIITVSHLSSIIMDYFGDGSCVSPVTGKVFGVKIQYFNEETPLGNAGALFKLRDQLSDDFLLLNADSIFSVDFKRFVNYHKTHGGLATVLTHPNNHPYDSGIVIADDNNVVQRWLTKECDRPQWYRNRANAGLHIINSKVLDMTGIDPKTIGTMVDGKIVKVDLDRQILKPLCGNGTMFCYDSPEYTEDMGTPDRYKKVCKDFAAGMVRNKNLKNKQKAIFLDRDGTINRHVGFLRNIYDFELLPGAADSINKINTSGYLAIVITNQPVIARGEVTCEELQMIHNKMETLLGQQKAYVDAIYFCPHHPDKGYKGEIPELKIDCECRKPKPGMLLKAADDFNIDLEQSWMIGDSENDIKTGQAVKCKTALIGNGQFEQEITVNSLREAVKYILQESND